MPWNRNLYANFLSAEYFIDATVKTFVSCFGQTTNASYPIAPIEPWPVGPLTIDASGLLWDFSSDPGFNTSAPAAIGDMGLGFQASAVKGSENNDSYTMREGKIQTLTNNAGGILGGLSNGMPVVVRVAFKPPSSIPKEQKTVNLKELQDTTVQVTGRHDPCIVPKAVPVVEAAVAIVLADHCLRAGVIARVLGKKPVDEINRGSKLQ